MAFSPPCREGLGAIQVERITPFPCWPELPSKLVHHNCSTEPPPHALSRLWHYHTVGSVSHPGRSTMKRRLARQVRNVESRAALVVYRRCDHAHPRRIYTGCRVGLAESSGARRHATTELFESGGGTASRRTEHASTRSPRFHLIRDPATADRLPLLSVLIVPIHYISMIMYTSSHYRECVLEAGHRELAIHYAGDSEPNKAKSEKNPLSGSRRQIRAAPVAPGPPGPGSWPFQPLSLGY